MGHNAELGRLGESIAAEHFEKIGYSVLARNWRCRHGEIDLIVGRGDHIVAVEVKTRSNERFGHPFEAITPAKRVRMYRLAQLWRASSDRPEARVRVDAIAIVLQRGRPARVEHLAAV